MAEVQVAEAQVVVARAAAVAVELVVRRVLPGLEPDPDQQQDRGPVKGMDPDQRRDQGRMQDQAQTRVKDRGQVRATDPVMVQASDQALRVIMRVKYDY